MAPPMKPTTLEDVILSYLRIHGEMPATRVASLCKISASTARRHLRNLKSAGVVRANPVHVNNNRTNMWSVIPPESEDERGEPESGNPANEDIGELIYEMFEGDKDRNKELNMMREIYSRLAPFPKTAQQRILTWIFDALSLREDL